MMKHARHWIALGLLAGLALAGPVQGQTEKFSKLVGPVKMAAVQKADVYELPFIFWGGDVATFHANGGLETKPDSLFGKLGLKFKLTNGDDFVAQVKNYVEGKTPFIRGTFSQLGQASEVLNTDPKTKPVVFLQLTWSAGDHMVARPTCKTLNDLKGKKIALQKGGPHVGMLDDILRTAGLKWKDVTPVWTNDVTGKDGPAELFKKDTTVDCCFVVTPDMQGLTSGIDKKGTGAEGTVKDAFVLVSTVTMKRSIADVYAVRKDFYDANKALVEKLAAGYLKGSEELLEMRAKLKDKEFKAKYDAVLKMARSIFKDKDNKELLPSDADADGLVADAVFVGFQGNQSFFQEKGNLSGFEAKMEHALSHAVGEGIAEARADFLPADFDFQNKIPGLVGGISAKVAPTPEKIEPDKLLFTFKIFFEPNQDEFPPEKYGADFKRAIEMASLFGNAVIVINGYADHTKLVGEFVKAGIATDMLRREGESGNYQYFFKDGKKLDLNDPKSMATVMDLVAKTDWAKAPANPKIVLDLCQKLSQDRADKVFGEVKRYAASKKYLLNEKLVKPVGLCILNPVVVRPKDSDQAAPNRRVEFSIYSIKATQSPSAEGVVDY